MANPTVWLIKVAKGSVDPDSVTVRRRDIVVWLPMDDDVKIQIDFRNKTPFKRKTFPSFPGAGEGVAAIVKGNAEFIEHPYKQPGSRRRRLRPLGDPVIIVRDNRVKKKKAGAKKVARKK